MPFYVPEYLNIVSESELLQYLNEQYFQNEKLTELEKLFGKLRSNNKYKTITYNTDPTTKEISLLVEDIFGFNSFQLIIEQSQLPNAFTYPLSSKIDTWNYKKCVKKSNKGLQFTPTAKVNVVAHITTALLQDDRFTDREIVAILLHEIGHNFSDSINNTLGIFSNFKKVLLIPAICSPMNIIHIKDISNTITGSITKYNDYMRKNYPSLVDAFNSLKMFIGLGQYVLLIINKTIGLIPTQVVTNLLNTFNNIVQQITKNPFNLVFNTIFKFFGKEDEYTSDSFCAMYGYGPDLTSALIKLERHNATPVDEALKSTTIGALYLALTEESIDFICSLISNNHPSTAKRLLNILNLLEQEYNKDYINPKTKKAIKEEMDEIKKLINDDINDKSFNGNTWRIMWNKYVYTNSNKGPKDKMIKNILDKIDNEIKE